MVFYWKREREFSGRSKRGQEGAGRETVLSAIAGARAGFRISPSPPSENPMVWPFMLFLLFFCFYVALGVLTDALHLNNKTAKSKPGRLKLYVHSRVFKALWLFLSERCMNSEKTAHDTKKRRL